MFYFLSYVGLPFWRSALVERDKVLRTFIYHWPFWLFATDLTLTDVIVCNFHWRNVRLLILFGVVGQKYVFCSTRKLQDILGELVKLTSACRQPVSQRRLCQFWPNFTGWNWNTGHSVRSGLHARSCLSSLLAFCPPLPIPPKGILGLHFSAIKTISVMYS